MLSHHLDELTTQGYTVLNGLYTRENILVFRAALDAIHDGLGRPPLTAVTKTDLGRGCVMSASGLAVGRLLDHAPEIAPRLLHPDVRAVLLGALGPELETEIVAGVVSDHRRAMHPWHTHIGGPDEDIIDASVACRALAVQRLSLLIYLDELAPGAGQLLIYPRRQSDPIAQPFADERAPWDGQVSLACPAGTAVLLDERTWHAATMRSLPGLRMFVGGQFIRNPALRASRADPALPRFHGSLFGGARSAGLTGGKVEGTTIGVDPRHPSSNPPRQPSSPMSQDDSLRRSGAKGALSGWRSRRTDGGEQNHLLFELLSDGGGHLVIEVSPTISAPAIRQTRAGGVSYRTFAGMTSAEALEITRAFAEELEAGSIDLTPAPRSPASPVRSAPRPQPASQADLAAHRFALQSSGFTVVSSLLDPRHLDELRETAARALAETQRQVELGALIPEEAIEHEIHPVARGVYLWGEPVLRLAENEAVRILCEEMIGPHKLIDVILFVCLPSPHMTDDEVEGWHRDIEFEPDAPRLRYLWFMFPLDDFRSDNGSTWVVAGSHRVPDPQTPRPRPGLHRFPSRVQMLLKAGDALVLDPMTLHSRGRNISQHPRRMLNMMICHEAVPIHWQWDLAGKKIHETASERIRTLLGGNLSAEERAAFVKNNPPKTRIQRHVTSNSPAWPALPTDWKP